MQRHPGPRYLADRPHHDGSPLYVSTQTPSLGDELKVRVRVPHAFGAMRIVRTRSNPDREPHFDDAVIVFEDDAAAAWGPGPVYLEPGGRRP